MEDFHFWSDQANLRQLRQSSQFPSIIDARSFGNILRDLFDGSCISIVLLLEPHDPECPMAQYVLSPPSLGYSNPSLEQRSVRLQEYMLDVVWKELCVEFEVVDQV